MKQKNNAEYFSHDAGMRNNIKVKALRRKFSHEGYAVWCYLLETIADADNFQIVLSDINLELLSGDYDVDRETLVGIIGYCVKLDLLQQEGDILYSEKLRNRLQPLMESRERRSIAGKKAAQSRWNSDAIATETDAIRMQKDAIRINDDAIRIQKEPNRIADSEKPMRLLPKNDAIYNKVKESKVKKGISKDIPKESEESLSPSSPDGEEAKRPAFPFEEIKKSFNTICTSYPTIQYLNESRRNKIRVRAQEMGGPEKCLEVFRRIFTEMETSGFLKGDNPRGWKANFDWLLQNEKNWVKVYEGNYQTTCHPGPQPRKSETVDYKNVNSIWN